MDSPRIREAVRAVLLDPAERILLAHYDGVSLGVDGGFWLCPGGGIEPGEEPEDALRRELREELGLEDISIAGPVWVLTRHFAMGEWDGQRDTFYVVAVPQDALAGPTLTAAMRREGLDAVRWFSPAELAACGDRLSPRDLVAQLDVVRRHGVPWVPRVIEALP